MGEWKTSNKQTEEIDSHSTAHAGPPTMTDTVQLSGAQFQEFYDIVIGEISPLIKQSILT